MRHGGYLCGMMVLDKIDRNLARESAATDYLAKAAKPARAGLPTRVDALWRLRRRPLRRSP